jgi:hypothetical protein
MGLAAPDQLIMVSKALKIYGKLDRFGRVGNPW